jgi:alanine racemase
MVVLKANAYGHGLIDMARLAGSNDLAVAIPEELKQIRDASLSNRVWVLEGPFGSACIELHSNNNVVWVIHSLWQLDLFLSDGSSAESSSAKGSSTKSSSTISPSTRFDICLKLDTGMNRLGMNPSDFELAVEKVQSNKSLNLYACMTHFSDSDLPGKEEVNHQLASFDKCISRVDRNKLLLSTANSGGILFYPQSHRDIVRPGIVLYGARPNPELHDQDFGFTAVMKFKSAVIAIRNVPKGRGVGYGSRWVAQRDSRVATIACGYGDGYPRHAPDGTPVAVYDAESKRYVRVPLVGRVSMDMITVDVTDMPRCEPGSQVELWGDEVSVDELALLSDTIAYELFCSITARVPRIII